MSRRRRNDGSSVDAHGGQATRIDAAPFGSGGQGQPDGLPRLLFTSPHPIRRRWLEASAAAT